MYDILQHRQWEPLGRHCVKGARMVAEWLELRTKVARRARGSARGDLGSLKWGPDNT